jgi:hypothetical protein
MGFCMSSLLLSRPKICHARRLGDSYATLLAHFPVHRIRIIDESGHGSGCHISGF